MYRILFILLIGVSILPSVCDGKKSPIAPFISLNDTVIFDLSQAECSSGFMEFPVYINSDEPVYALDFSMKFDPANMSFVTAINLKPYLVTSAWFNSSDSTLRFSSFSMIPVDNNTPLVKLKFSLPSAQINYASFDSVYTLLNGDDCNKKFIDPVLPINIEVIGSPTILPGDSTMLSVNIIPGVNYLWSTGETSPVIYVSSSGTYVVTIASVMGCNSVSSIEISMSSPLPVELIMFDVKQSYDEMSLSWITSSEINNDYFEIQRTGNSCEWQTLGSIEGAGNSNNNNYYSFTDKTPMKGVNFYRLKQVDFDGAFKFSSIKKCVYEKSGTELTLHVFPNPVRNIQELTFEISLEESPTNGILKFTDQKGVEVFISEIGLSERTQTVSIWQLKSYSSLQPGLYIATIEADGKVAKCRFMIY